MSYNYGDNLGLAEVVHINPQPVAVRPQREYNLIGLAGEVLPVLIAEAFGD